MATINWYPGHMAKAKREMEANIGLIDCAVELLDARAPLASRNPDLKQMLGNKPKITVLNKSDLADPDLTKAWLSYFRFNCQCYHLCGDCEGVHGYFP